MQNKQNLITIVFVLVAGLVGGYMIAQHVGHAAESHQKMHEMKESGTMDNPHAMPPAADAPAGDMHAPHTDDDMQGGADADIHVQ